MLYLEREILSTNNILFFKKTNIRLKDVLSHPLRLLFIFFFFFSEDKLVFPLIFIYLSWCCIMKNKRLFQSINRFFDTVAKFEKLLRIFIYLKMSKNLSFIFVLNERNFYFIKKKLCFVDIL